MPVLSAHGLAKSFGAEDIFSDVSFTVPHRARIGLVGPNGVGKTTLLRILIGEDEASAGGVHFARGLRFGYLPQEARLDSNLSLWDECLSAFAPLLEMQAELTRLEAQMSDERRAEAALETYGKLQAVFDQQGGYTYETRIRQTLTGLGFSENDYRRPLTQLSGGQRTRAFLARLLLDGPDLLLLDEPTNHLDISAIEWLESFFKDWDGAVVIVSHDRYFLDQVASTIWEMTPSLEVFRGNYSAYLLQREERYQHRLDEYESQQAFIEKEEDYIRRNIAGQNTRQAQGRRKRLERMLKEVKSMPRYQTRSMHLRLSPAGRSGDLVLRTYALSVGYADEGKPLFQVPDLILQRGECAAIIGPNGAGKTTFLKTVLGQIPPLGGEAVLGSSLKIGYFAQAHEGLHPDWTLMQEIELASPGMLPAEIRDYLAKFLFTGDDVFKTIETLSGGERGRLALAILSLSGSNLLLLDEPTNHLDLAAQEVLQSILSSFPGTILLVSHDRYLIDGLATQIWEVLPEEGSLRVFPGSYSEYRAARQSESSAAAAPVMPQAVSAPRPAESGLSKMELKRRQQRLERLEGEIAALEQRLTEVARQLEVPSGDAGRIHELSREYAQIQHHLEKHMEEWSRLSEEVQTA